MFRLKKLWVENYKNLKNFTIDFTDGDGFSMLIGNNGSGKSNVLEVISGIFHDARKVDNFSLASNYCIEYTIDNIEISIEKRGGRRQFKVSDVTIKHIEFISTYIPKNVVAIYSGEELRLWTTYFAPYYKQYLGNITNPSRYTQNMYLAFINRFYWNIALFVMLLSNSNDIENFIKNTLKIHVIDRIGLTFDIKKISTTENQLLHAFLYKINPNNESEIDFNLKDLKTLMLDYTEQEVFNLLVQAHMPKINKLIKGIEIVFNNGLTTSALSEGEKKFILVQATLEFLSDERTLLLFDEPDSHVNEAKKNSMYYLMQNYEQPQIIMTTHSPTLTKIANSNEKLILQKDENGSASVIPCSDIEALEKISDGLWAANAESILFISQKPLVLVEGIGDINYINQAINVLNQDEPKYKTLDCEFLLFGGTGNAFHFIEKITPCISRNRKIIVIFDRDDAGKTGMAKCITNEQLDKQSSHTYNKDNFYFFMLPKTSEHSSSDFLIEDYFDKAKKKALVQSLVDNADGNYNEYPNKLKDKLKKELEDFYPTAQAADLQGFKVLLDRIYNIITDTEQCVLVI